MVSSYCCSTYRVEDPFSSLGNFSSFSIGGSVFHPIADCEHPFLCLPGTDIASQETALSWSFLPKIRFAKLKKNKDQSGDIVPLLKIGNKPHMEGATETKFGAVMKEWTI